MSHKGEFRCFMLGLVMVLSLGFAGCSSSWSNCDDDDSLTKEQKKSELANLDQDVKRLKDEHDSDWHVTPKQSIHCEGYITNAGEGYITNAEDLINRINALNDRLDLLAQAQGLEYQPEGTQETPAKYVKVKSAANNHIQGTHSLHNMQDGFDGTYHYTGGR